MDKAQNNLPFAPLQMRGVGVRFFTTMKKLLFIIHCSLFLVSATAQREYWGMTQYGGPGFLTNFYGAGVLFKTDKQGRNYKVVRNFDTATGFEPQGSLIQAPNGKFYGFTTNGACSCKPGFLFEFDPIRSVYKTLLKSDTLPRQNSHRWGTPFLASNGKIYSLAGNTVLETDPNTGNSIVIADSLNPAGGENYFMQASNGKVYFVTASYFLIGQFGALYELNLPTKTVIKKYQFLSGNGAAPYGSLVEWSPGVLYGTFSNGSGPITSTGGIFSYNLTTQTFEQKRTFYSIGVSGVASGTNGGLTRYGNKLYGATVAQGVNNDGFIYSYDPATNALDTLINFATANASYPYDTLHQVDTRNLRGWGTELISGYDGRLYGLTSTSMFSYDVATNKVFSLVSLQREWGGYPAYAHLLQTCTKPYFYFTIPDTLHVFQGQPVNFAIGTPNTDTFRWYKDNIYQATQTDSLLHITAAALTDQGWYNTKLTNECGDSITKKFYLKVDIVTPLGLAFTGRVNNRNALLQWTDPSAKEVETYVLQRSTDGRSFTAINITKAKPNQQAYNYTDEAFETFANANNGKAFYRLLQQNKDGKKSYSNIIGLLTTANSPLTITPNPASEQVTITLPITIKKASLTILDSKGAMVWKKATTTRSTTISTANWANGEYTIVVADENGKIDSKKLVVQHL